MENLSLTDTLELAKSWARETGKIHLQYFRSLDLSIETKSNVSDVVTRVDKECEAFLINEIRKNFPSHSILGEESGAHSGDSDFCWAIDPLDGTNNYSQGLPVFTVSIGLQYKGESVLGVVFAPYFDEMYTAIKGKGAFLNGKAIHVSGKTDLAESILGSGFPYDKGSNPENNVENAARIIPQLRGFRRMGSAAYDLCCVAASFLDGYWELNLNLWDVCAGVVIVEEAGGVVLPFRDDRRISIIAANHVLTEKIKKVIK